MITWHNANVWLDNCVNKQGSKSNFDIFAVGKDTIVLAKVRDRAYYWSYNIKRNACAHFGFNVPFLRNVGSNILCQVMKYLLLNQGNPLKGQELQIINMACRLLDFLQVVIEAVEILIFELLNQGRLAWLNRCPLYKGGSLDSAIFQSLITAQK